MQTEQKITIQEEELLAMDADVSAKIHTAELLSEDMGNREADINAVAAAYKNVFKNKDDAVYFSMLPLTDADRAIVMRRAIELHHEAVKGGIVSLPTVAVE
jgi:hypothetical protein